MSDKRGNSGSERNMKKKGGGGRRWKEAIRRMRER